MDSEKFWNSNQKILTLLVCHKQKNVRNRSEGFGRCYFYIVSIIVSNIASDSNSKIDNNSEFSGP